MRRYFLLCPVLFKFATVAAQFTVKQSLFYALDSAEPLNVKSRLDSLTYVIGNDSATVHISGYADFIGSRTYNLALSKRRADVVKNYLLGRLNAPDALTFNCIAFGEDNSHENESPWGEPAQRRVDIVVTKKQATVVKKEKPESIIEVTPAVEVNQAPALENEIRLPEKGQSIVLEGLLFVPGRHVWLPSSNIVLTRLLKALNDQPGLRIEIQGHICCVEGPDDALDFDTNDMKLSENRARAVYNYLVKRGIDGSRLQYNGYGHSQPKFQELTSFQEQQNRRVEVKVLGQ